jgi:hypothetical protein
MLTNLENLNILKDLQEQKTTGNNVKKNNLTSFSKNYKDKIAKYIKEQSNWKIKIEEKQKQLLNLKTIIKNSEIHSATLFSIFAISIFFCLVSLFILTPLSVLGVAIRATSLMWGLGMGSGIIGVLIGLAAIKSTVSLHKNKDIFEKITSERDHFKHLIDKRDTISTFLNYNKLNTLGVIEISQEDHLSIIRSDLWHHSLFVDYLEDLELAEQYEKNGLMIPVDLQKKIQKNFFNLIH